MLLDAPRNFHARHKGHRVVNNGDVGLFLNGPCYGLFAIARLGNNLPAGAPFQNGTQSRPHRFMIVSYKNPLHDRTSLQCRSASDIGMLYQCRRLELPGSLHSSNISA